MVLMLAILGLAACGSGEDSSLPAVEQDDRGKVVVAALGDSITAGTPFFDPLADAGDSSAPYTATAQRRNPGTEFRNCGANGEVTAVIAERLDDCARGADVLIVQGGINDIAQGLDVSVTARNIEKMVREGRRRGLRVGVCEVLPWNNGYPEAAPKVDALNRAIRRIVTAEKVTLQRWYDVLEDPRAPGRMRGDLTVDGDHPTVEGYRMLGDAFLLPR